MRPALPRVVLPLLTIVSLGSALGASPAQGDSPGGAQAPSAPLSGGIEYGVPARKVQVQRPGPSTMRIPDTAMPGPPPRLLLRIDEPGVGTVNAQVSVISVSTHSAAITVNLGWVHTARTMTVHWPHGRTLGPGVYEVSLNVHDHHGGTLLRSPHHTGVSSLTIDAPPKAAPKAAAPVAPPAPAVLPAGLPTPAQSVADGAVFPVAGPHNFGGPENRFGAPRSGYFHEGQDVLTAEGTPVVVPLAGTILSTSYQAGGAGYYAVERTTVGFDFMYAHCEASSLAVSTGQAVAAGQALCKAGQTGDATAPHLHFEMWVGGWQAAGGYPIDPLPYLKAWEHAGTTG
jgi:biotin carboxyl carrier protein